MLLFKAIQLGQGEVQERLETGGGQTCCSLSDRAAVIVKQRCYLLYDARTNECHVVACSVHRFKFVKRTQTNTKSVYP